jgi:hypothetical protein
LRVRNVGSHPSNVDRHFSSLTNSKLNPT